MLQSLLFGALGACESPSSRSLDQRINQDQAVVPGTPDCYTHVRRGQIRKCAIGSNSAEWRHVRSLSLSPSKPADDFQPPVAHVSSCPGARGRRRRVLLLREVQGEDGGDGVHAHPPLPAHPAAPHQALQIRRCAALWNSCCRVVTCVSSFFILICLHDIRSSSACCCLIQRNHRGCRPHRRTSL